MKEQEKQIEEITIQEMAKEIARVLFEIRQDMTSVIRYIRHEFNKELFPNSSIGEFIDRHLKYRELANETSKNILKNLNENNKLKEIESLCVEIARNGLPENAMVLTERQHEIAMKSQFDIGFKFGSKETAKEILDKVSWHYGGAWLVELYKEYGLEVE